MPERGKWTFHDDHLSARIGGIAVEVRGDELKIAVPLQGGVTDFDRVVKSYGEPVYTTLEDFLRRAGDDARIGLIVYEEVGPVLCLYNGAPYTDLSEDEAKRLGIDPEERGGYGDGGGFGYIVNIMNPWFDELGYAPFPLNTETVEERDARVKAGYDAMMSAFGGEENVTVINANPNERVLGIVYDDSKR